MAVGMAVMGAGGALSAYGSYKQSQADAAAADYNAAIAEMNSRITYAQSKEEERRVRVMGRKAIGNIRASYGASGVTTEGSPLDVLQESAAAAEMDALTVRHAGQVRAAGYLNEAAVEATRANSTRKNAWMGPAAALLGAGAGMQGK